MRLLWVCTVPLVSSCASAIYTSLGSLLEILLGHLVGFCMMRLGNAILRLLRLLLPVSHDGARALVLTWREL